MASWPRVCECGHFEADHQRVAVGSILYGSKYGRCLVCDCPEYVRDLSGDDQQEAA